MRKTFPALKIFQSLAFTCAIFGFAGWAYIVINSEVHIQTLGTRLTHFFAWPHEDTFGEICFLVSIVSTFAYRLIRDDK